MGGGVIESVDLLFDVAADYARRESLRFLAAPSSSRAPN